jgi:hypothetical protein
MVMPRGVASLPKCRMPELTASCLLLDEGLPDQAAVGQASILQSLRISNSSALTFGLRSGLLNSIANHTAFRTPPAHLIDGQPSSALQQSCRSAQVSLRGKRELLALV